MKGIDVYNGTGTVDFTAVKNAGYEFVMIKSSEGHTLADKSLSVKTSISFLWIIHFFQNKIHQTCI